MQLTLPNSLTLMRVLMIPLYVLFFYVDWHYARQTAAIIFIIAAITDWLDGYLARRLQQTSRFGAFLDPVADKLMVSTALVLLVQHDPHWWLAVAAAVIIGREITISALREWMAELGQRAAVAVGWVGKVKTACQMVSIILLTWRDSLFTLPIYNIGLSLLLVAVVLTIWSMVVYLKAAWPALRDVAE